MKMRAAILNGTLGELSVETIDIGNPAPARCA